jgi:chemotaxis protein CheX
VLEPKGGAGKQELSGERRMSQQQETIGNQAPAVARDQEWAHQSLAAAIIQSTEAVFGTMLGVETETGAAEKVWEGPSPTAGVVSFIGMAGEWAGTGSLAMSAPLACRLSSALLMTELSNVDEEVLDAVAEITNMILGNVKSALEDQLGGMGLSIPTVIFGRNFTTRSMGSHQWTRVQFHCPGGEGEPEHLVVYACLLPSREGHALRTCVQPPGVPN